MHCGFTSAGESQLTHVTLTFHVNSDDLCEIYRESCQPFDSKMERTWDPHRELSPVPPRRPMTNLERDMPMHILPSFDSRYPLPFPTSFSRPPFQGSVGYENPLLWNIPRMMFSEDYAPRFTEFRSRAPLLADPDARVHYAQHTRAGATDIRVFDDSSSREGSCGQITSFGDRGGLLPFPRSQSSYLHQDTDYILPHSPSIQDFRGPLDAAAPIGSHLSLKCSPSPDFPPRQSSRFLLPDMISDETSSDMATEDDNQPDLLQFSAQATFLSLLDRLNDKPRAASSHNEHVSLAEVLHTQCPLFPHQSTHTSQDLATAVSANLGTAPCFIPKSPSPGPDLRRLDVGPSNDATRFSCRFSFDEPPVLMQQGTKCSVTVDARDFRPVERIARIDEAGDWSEADAFNALHWREGCACRVCPKFTSEALYPLDVLKASGVHSSGVLLGYRQMPAEDIRKFNWEDFNDYEEEVSASSNFCRPGKRLPQFFSGKRPFRSRSRSPSWEDEDSLDAEANKPCSTSELRFPTDRKKRSNRKKVIAKQLKRPKSKAARKKEHALLSEELDAYFAKPRESVIPSRDITFLKETLETTASSPTPHIWKEKKQKDLIQYVDSVFVHLDLPKLEDAAQSESPESPEPERTLVVPAGVAAETTATVRNLGDCSCISPHGSPAHSSIQSKKRKRSGSSESTISIGDLELSCGGDHSMDAPREIVVESEDVLRQRLLTALRATAEANDIARRDSLETSKTILCVEGKERVNIQRHTKISFNFGSLHPPSPAILKQNKSTAAEVSIADSKSSRASSTDLSERLLPSCGPALVVDVCNTETADSSMGSLPKFQSVEPDLSVLRAPSHSSLSSGIDGSRPSFFSRALRDSSQDSVTAEIFLENIKSDNQASSVQKEDNRPTTFTVGGFGSPSKASHGNTKNKRIPPADFDPVTFRVKKPKKKRRSFTVVKEAGSSKPIKPIWSCKKKKKSGVKRRLPQTPKIPQLRDVTRGKAAPDHPFDFSQDVIYRIQGLETDLEEVYWEDVDTQCKIRSLEKALRSSRARKHQIWMRMDHLRAEAEDILHFANEHVAESEPSSTDSASHMVSNDSLNPFVRLKKAKSPSSDSSRSHGTAESEMGIEEVDCPNYIRLPLWNTAAVLRPFGFENDPLLRALREAKQRQISRNGQESRDLSSSAEASLQNAGAPAPKETELSADDNILLDTAPRGREFYGELIDTFSLICLYRFCGGFDTIGRRSPFTEAFLTEIDPHAAYCVCDLEADCTRLHIPPFSLEFRKEGITQELTKLVYEATETADDLMNWTSVIESAVEQVQEDRSRDEEVRDMWVALLEKLPIA